MPQRPLARLGGKGYDTDDSRYADWFRGTLSMIPTNSTRRRQFTVDHVLDSLRNRIELLQHGQERLPCRYPLRQAGYRLSGFRRHHFNSLLP